MAKKRAEGSLKKPTKTSEFVKIDDLSTYVKSRWDAYRISPNAIDWCLRLAAGQDAMSATAELYSLNDRYEIKHKSQELLRNPKHQDMINIFRQNMKHQAITDANTLLIRLETLYAEAIYDDNKKLALEIIKQMKDIVMGLNGNMTVNDITIKFEVPNILPKDTIIDIEPEQVNE